MVHLRYDFEHKKNPETLDFTGFPGMVRVAGLEPVQGCPHKNLNLARLPIPPYPQMGGFQQIFCSLLEIC